MYNFPKSRIQQQGKETEKVCNGLCVCAQSLQSCPTLCAPRTVARQAPLSIGFSRQEYWSGLPCPFPGDLPNLGTEPECPASPALQVDSLWLSH